MEIKNLLLIGGAVIGGYVLIKTISASAAQAPAQEPSQPIFIPANTADVAQPSGVGGGPDLTVLAQAIAASGGASAAASQQIAQIMATAQKDISLGDSQAQVKIAQAAMQSDLLQTLAGNLTQWGARVNIGYNDNGLLTSMERTTVPTAPAGVSQVNTAQGLITLIPNALLTSNATVAAPGTTINGPISTVAMNQQQYVNPNFVPSVATLQ